ncbi:MAG TPA: NUDIX hydrolase [Candidatus Moranbacteria bacterium]|jgi:8-oxo-dGTP pyrophosphatase MutT (NUDIX family)|nr:NUDIX hydrolase [Candidatus Moranbacteria bacterium]HOF42362.1 NUDIX hydrolase [Candidatus Moranbacteria bacterium]HPX94464.1 NUDIX hydrolase [Candidatus Moranbacteria bacterium]HQB59641.1 NUDIX hydrolase [Candidatus Moranbacteria bacterium]
MNKIIIASGPVILEDNKVILNQHGNTNFWKFCGGKVEDFEHDLKEHAKREVKEEMGIEVDILDRTPYIMYTQKETPEGKIDVILVHFLAKRIGEIRPGEDIREWKWIPIEELGKENLAPNILPTLKHFGFIK